MEMDIVTEILSSNPPPFPDELAHSFRKGNFEWVCEKYDRAYSHWQGYMFLAYIFKTLSTAITSMEISIAELKP